MKKLLTTIVLSLFLVAAQAQFTTATLQATGLTCAMCNNAINKALKALPFVDSVKSDIKNASFHIVFRKNATFEIDKLQKAVDEAGFSVGSLKLTGTFNQVKIANDAHVKIGEEEFHFLNVSSQVLNGENTLVVVDKNFVTAKEFKKFSSSTKMSCLQTGKASSCCIKDGVPDGTRIYHVTI